MLDLDCLIIVTSYVCFQTICHCSFFSTIVIAPRFCPRLSLASYIYSVCLHSSFTAYLSTWRPGHIVRITYIQSLRSRTTLWSRWLPNLWSKLAPLSSSWTRLARIPCLRRRDLSLNVVSGSLSDHVGRSTPNNNWFLWCDSCSAAPNWILPQSAEMQLTVRCLLYCEPRSVPHCTTVSTLPHVDKVHSSCLSARALVTISADSISFKYCTANCGTYCGVFCSRPPTSALSRYI